MRQEKDGERRKTGRDRQQGTRGEQEEEVPAEKQRKGERERPKGGTGDDGQEARLETDTERDSVARSVDGRVREKDRGVEMQR